MNDATGEPVPIVILGAGPAGLGAALRLARRRRFKVTVVEKNAAVAGNAGSFEMEGLRVDYGSHRLHPSCAPDILADIQAMLGSDLLDRCRHGRIRLRGRWIHFPLKPVDLALHLPLTFLLGNVRDLWTRNGHRPAVETFASVLERGLGQTICRDFYFPYALKIWGLPPAELDAEQARRRISAGSMAGILRKVVNGLPGVKGKKGSRFFYPKRGYGQISEAYYRAATEAGAAVRLRTTLSSIELKDGRAAFVRTTGERTKERLPALQILSTVPLPLLVKSITPAAPSEVLTSAAALQYRAMILIYLVVSQDRFSEYDAHYFPEIQIPITRLSEPKNYSLAELPGTTILCAELPCSVDDSVWTATDQELGKLVLEALACVGIPVRAPVRRISTRRLQQAYPIYSRGFREHFERLDRWVSCIDGLLTLGRQGLFAHDNTHHALAMAYAAANCIEAGGTLDRERWVQYRSQFQKHVVED